MNTKTILIGVGVAIAAYLLYQRSRSSADPKATAEGKSAIEELSSSLVSGVSSWIGSGSGDDATPAAGATPKAPSIVDPFRKAAAEISGIGERIVTSIRRAPPIGEVQTPAEGFSYGARL